MCVQRLTLPSDFLDANPWAFTQFSVFNSAEAFTIRPPPSNHNTKPRSTSVVCMKIAFHAYSPAKQKIQHKAKSNNVWFTNVNPHDRQKTREILNQDN
jgi:hypothetical protein